MFTFNRYFYLVRDYYEWLPCQRIKRVFGKPAIYNKEYSVRRRSVGGRGPKRKKKCYIDCVHLKVLRSRLRLSYCSMAIAKLYNIIVLHRL